MRFVEPNGTFKATATASTVPTDRLFSQQWALASADGIGAPGAWWTSRGAGAVIAIAGHRHRPRPTPTWPPTSGPTPAEVPGNGVDDEGNGYVDDVHGANVLTGDGAVQDGFGHGTAMSGGGRRRGQHHRRDRRRPRRQDHARQGAGRRRLRATPAR